MNQENQSQQTPGEPIISDEAVVKYNTDFNPSTQETTSTTTGISEGAEITDEPVIIHNPNYQPDSTETEVNEVPQSTNQLAETGSDSIPALGVIGGTALALGAGATAFKRRKSRRPQ